MAELTAQAGLSARGFYELRDSTCEKCEVKMERIEPKEKGGKVRMVCPVCGGSVGRLKQRGVLGPEEGTIEEANVKSK